MITPTALHHYQGLHFTRRAPATPTEVSLSTAVVGARAGGYRLDPPALAAVAALAVFTGLLAAVVPAYTAARAPVVAALTGRRNTPSNRR